MLQCKIDYLAIYAGDAHAIALFFWDDEKEDEAVHIAFDAEVFKGTFNQIANALEEGINSCFEKLKEKENGKKIHSESNQETRGVTQRVESPDGQKDSSGQTECGC